MSCVSSYDIGLRFVHMYAPFATNKNIYENTATDPIVEIFLQFMSSFNYMDMSGESNKTEIGNKKRSPAKLCMGIGNW